MTENMIDLSRLESYKENNRIEAKKALGGLPHSLWETYSAFANTLGGIILLGVEEQKDRSFLVHDLPDPQRLIDEFFSIISQKKYISNNILNREQVRIETLNGKRIVAITVPRAARNQRPVYIGTQVYTGSYRRDGEGDYHCTREEVDRMLDEAEKKGNGNEVLEHSSMEVFHYDTVSAYRTYLKRERPGHVWLALANEVFLEKLGAAAYGKDGRRYPTAAGLLMFGKEKEIVKQYPCYALDYQEQEPAGIWVDRVISDTGDWSGNLFDFFRLVSERIIRKRSFPAVCTKGRKQETPVHRAIREVLANCLVNADYEAKQGVVVRNTGAQVTFENPGSFGIDREQALEGGISSPRNPALIKMFHLINIGNGEGRGLAEIYSFWKAQGWAMPKIREELCPERIQVSLNIEPQENPGNQSSLRQTRKRAAEIVYESQRQQLIDYVTAHIEVTTADAAALLDIGKSGAKQILSKMVEEGILERKGQKGDRTYQLKV